MKNQLLQQPFDTAYNTPPFSQITDKDYKPAIEQAIAEAKAEIDQITSNKEQPTFGNTIEALAESGEKLSRITSIFFNLNSAETNDQIQKIAQEVSPLLSAFGNDTMMNKDLFERVKEVHDKTDKEELNEEQRELLRKTYKNFSRNGALLDDEKQARLREISEKLGLLSLQFGQNVLAETNDFILHIEQEKDLEGLPQDEVHAAKSTAEEKGLSGWAITLQMPSFLGFMKYAQNRELREKLYRANGAKSFRDNDKNNSEIIKKIVNLRYEKAQLLGYSTHADYVLEERMAKTPKKVNDFLRDLLKKARPFAEKDIDKLSQFAQEKEGISPLMPWDHAYFSEKYKKQFFELSDQELKPYFKLENVVNGAFSVAEKLYGLSFEKIKNIDTYHPEVETYQVVRNNKIIGVLYTDFFPRKGKRPGAWMTSYRDGHYKGKRHMIPLISIVCNFTKPTQEKPSLLTFNEVTTLFHEFGHALHGLLANTRYESLAGTNVSWDFVELPSQFMENYCYEPEALALFAKHYETGEVIPQKYIDKIVESAQFMEGYQTLRQLSFGLLDMAWHSVNPKEIKDVDAYETKAFEATQVYPKIEGTNMSTAFSHIFQGGYSAGYYSYKWAEVLDADAFAYFKEKGIFNPKVAQKFYKVLSSGGTIEPMKLYQEFRGHQPDNQALLVRAGLVE